MFRNVNIFGRFLKLHKLSLMIIAIKQGKFVVVDYPMCTCVIYVKLLQCTIGIILVYILRSSCPYILSIYFLQNMSSWNFRPEENSSSEYMISSFRPKILYKCSALKRSTSKTFHFSLQCLQSNMKASHYIKKCKKCLNSFWGQATWCHCTKNEVFH